MPNPAQQLVLTAWVALALVLAGVGLLGSRLAGSTPRGGRDFVRAAWLGWALVLSFLQLWHLVLPVDDRARLAVAALGAAGWLAAGPGGWRAFGRALLRHAPALVVTAAAAWWLSDRALAGPRYGDTGMYLVPTVHWYSTHAAVPGLANLFVPLGHNISYFLYGALLDGGPFARNIYPLANTTLVLLLAARGFGALFALLRRATARPAGHLFHALALLPVADYAWGMFLTSPMPDFAIYVFGLVLVGELVELLERDDAPRGELARLAFLCSVGLTVKLSLAGLALSVAAAGWIGWSVRTRAGFAGAARAGLLAFAAALVPSLSWMARNVVSSGYPFYPVFLWPLPVDWIARVDATAWIQAPMPPVPLSTIFTDTAWWKVRLESLGWTSPDVLRVLGLAAGALPLALASWLAAWWKGRPRPTPLALVLLPVAGFLFAFHNAPMPRFQGANLWLASLLPATAALVSWGRAARVLAVAAALFGCAWPGLRGAEPWLGLGDFDSLSPPRLHETKLASGLTVLDPENDVCWYAPLPCSPEPPPGLRLRRPGDLGSGFAIDDPDAAGSGGS